MQWPDGTLSISFHVVCAAQPVLKARVDNVTLTLEERVLPHDCVAGQLSQTVLTNARCLIQNALRSCTLFLFIHPFITRPEEKHLVSLIDLFIFSCKLLMHTCGGAPADEQNDQSGGPLITFCSSDEYKFNLMDHNSLAAGSLCKK